MPIIQGCFGLFNFFLNKYNYFDVLKDKTNITLSHISTTIVLLRRYMWPCGVVRPPNHLLQQHLKDLGTLNAMR